MAAGDVIRRKVAAARGDMTDGAPGADRGWRLALARAANDEIGLPLDVTRLTVARRSLPELLDIAPDRALIAVLEGPGEGLGIIALSAPVLAAMIEMQTIGRVTSAAPSSRKPTRTDATMVAGVIDRALEDLEIGLDHDPDVTWAGGFRYASFLDDRGRGPSCGGRKERDGDDGAARRGAWQQAPPDAAGHPCTCRAGAVYPCADRTGHGDGS
jgi:flagellar motor switch protein FliM